MQFEEYFQKLRLHSKINLIIISIGTLFIFFMLILNLEFSMLFFLIFLLIPVIFFSYERYLVQSGSYINAVWSLVRYTEPSITITTGYTYKMGSLIIMKDDIISYSIWKSRKTDFQKVFKNFHILYEDIELGLLRIRRNIFFRNEYVNIFDRSIGKEYHLYCSDNEEVLEKIRTRCKVVREEAKRSY